MTKRQPIQGAREALILQRSNCVSGFLSRLWIIGRATTRALDASGADGVVLARAGQDLSQYGLRYSHLGFAYRDTWQGQSVWRVAHKLNHCGSADAALYRQGLGEFFLDRPHRYEAAFVVLGADTQAKLLPLLRDNQRLATWHTPRYNMLAYPWALTYQQSNQWAIETLAGASDPAASSRSQAQASCSAALAP